MSHQAHHQLARDFFAAVAAGDLPDALLTADMTADMTGWITTGGTMDKARYQYLIRLLAAMCDGPLRFTIHALTAEDDRVVAEVESEGRLIDGAAYRQTYVFVLRIRDGRIAAVAEHYNALVAQEKLVPLMAAAARKLERDA
ncbi:nuclear transport factor 2 family protein [Sphingobium sufflavum]|uniref:nuclear transport factor 2 family protein n=1 Tax=Sphingobium sufflavum TaxID=1129547 RepID=UPI001F17075E|nr:nuclear transport factor 2 family protein [Sphingobium sufflavum]MCE7798316.1 nuclear transport factor 2 family protein [Sphingobium sufflavum]